jgi:glycosyltransferase involved in cell wall biosynthesis
MLNVAIVIFDITKCAGTERAVCNLANLLVNSKKYDVSIISIFSSYGEAVYRLENAVSIHHLAFNQCNNKLKRIYIYRLILKAINKICSKKEIKIILGTTHGINIILFFLRKGKKTIACEHLNYTAAPLISRLLRRIVYPFINAVVVLTSTDAKYYVFHKNVAVIPNSLSFLPGQRSKLVSKKILAVGRLTRQKGFDLLIDTVACIKSHCNGWKVKIIGTGEDEDKLRKQIKSLNVKELIEICPPTNNIVEEYLEASIFVMSSRNEGLPMVLIEAQSCGLPIIAFDCPEGPAEIIHHNKDGLLVEKENIDLLGKALLELMYNQKKRMCFGENALQGITRYKSENIYKMWEKLLETL